MKGPRSIALGIDIGGTDTKFGLVTGDGELLAGDRVPTDPAAGPEALAQSVHARLAALTSTAQIDPALIRKAGIGAPGPIDALRGTIRNAPNLPGWSDVPLVALFSRQLGPAFSQGVSLENDANAAAVAEYRVGAGLGRSWRSMVLLTLGTGLGGGLVLDGRLFRGDHGSAGEIGHVIVEPGGRACSCGQRGCLERYVSATAIVERCRDAIAEGKASVLAHRFSAGHAVESEDVLAAAAGDETASQIWMDTARYLAIGCINIMRMLDVDAVVLGGGVAKAGEALLKPTRTWYGQLDWRMTPDRPEITLATLPDHAGVIGAALLALQQ